MKEITLRIMKDGTVQGETHGIKGKACLSYIAVLEKLTAAKCVDSDFTAEYKEKEYLTADAAHSVHYTDELLTRQGV
ncbi:MAG: DUF2997 domain-containing protein [Firmicutes bacterium]|nr:DUF2997 domain-containing protein [Bacillota bacterium]